MPSLKLTVLAVALALVASCACQPAFPPAEQTATAVGDPAGAAATQSLGPAGGSLTSSDGKFTLTVPPDALTTAVTLSVTPLANTAHGGVGPGWRLEPDGTTFAKPVTVSVKLPPGALEGTPAGAFGFASQRADGFWKWETAASVDTTTNTASASISHFSDWSAVYGFTLRPPSKVLKAGATLQLIVAFCYSPDTGDEDLTALGYECDVEASDPENTPLLPTAKVTNWAVNGVSGGNATVGTVAGGEQPQARFTAPAQRPNPDTVSVSADIAWREKGKLVVASSITIDPPVRVYNGTAQYSYSGAESSYTITGNVQLTETGAGGGAFTSEGPVGLKWSAPNCLPVDQEVTAFGQLDFDVPDPGAYTFKLGLDNFQVTCNGASTFISVPQVFTAPCPEDASPAPRMGNGAELHGTSACGGGSFTFSLTRSQ